MFGSGVDVDVGGSKRRNAARKRRMLKRRMHAMMMKARLRMLKLLA